MQQARFWLFRVPRRSGKLRHKQLVQCSTDRCICHNDPSTPKRPAWYKIKYPSGGSYLKGELVALDGPLQHSARHGSVGAGCLERLHDFAGARGARVCRVPQQSPPHIHRPPLAPLLYPVLEHPSQLCSTLSVTELTWLAASTFDRFEARAANETGRAHSFQMAQNAGAMWSSVRSMQRMRVTNFTSGGLSPVGATSSGTSGTGALMSSASPIRSTSRSICRQGLQAKLSFGGVLYSRETCCGGEGQRLS